MMLRPVRTIAPAETPLTLSEAKTHCRVDSSDEDTLLNALISAATEHLDGFSGLLGRALITQSWRQDFDRFEACMRLPLDRVSSITSIKYFDDTNTEQTVAASVYSLHTDALGPYIKPNDGEYWPSGVHARDDAVQITFVCGYGDAAAVPQPIKQAMLLMIEDWYDTRSSAIYGTTATEAPIAAPAWALLQPYRRVTP